jgi:deferrochelatase/peroxidase EfeB
MSRPATELDDIQALVRTGFPDLTEACFVMARIVDVAAARAWLASAPVTSAHLERHMECALQIALTAEGLRRLGLSDDALAGFSQEFHDGLADDEARSRRLGDIGASAPGNWDWGAGKRMPDIAVLLYAAPGALQAWQKRVLTPEFLKGFEQITILATSDMKDHEPFGFKDGVSQPTLDWGGRREPGTDQDLDYGNLSSLGEFLLGHRNEYGLKTERPLVDVAADPVGCLAAAHDGPGKKDLGLNGSYLVFRQLDQDVRAFWRYASGHAPEDGGVALAETMVGRKLNGDPLLKLSPELIAGIGRKDEDYRLNNFTYDADAQGGICPLGAHVRRANPRTGDMPGGRVSLVMKLVRMIGFGMGDDPRRDLIASARFHRILRRGREYGQALPPAEAAVAGAPDPKSGLHFICLAANIERQFEFIQNAWLVSAKFDGMSDEADPLLGNRAQFPAGFSTNSFTAPQGEGSCRRYAGLPGFVTVRGGAYFFLPSLRALRYLAVGPAAQSKVSLPVGS